jgi:predicted GNAT family N-acyltransferase
VPADFYFEPLNARHERKAFTCAEEPPLEQYIRAQASQDVKRKLAAVFVLTNDGRTVAGYYTLSQFSIKLDDLPSERSKKLPKYPHIPATLIGRLAVNDSHRKQRLGERLLMDALQRSFDFSTQVGSYAVVVDAKSDRAKSFYLRYGFSELPGIANRLFLPMGLVADLIRSL